MFKNEINELPMYTYAAIIVV